MWMREEASEKNSESLILKEKEKKIERKFYHKIVIEHLFFWWWWAHGLHCKWKFLYIYLILRQFEIHPPIYCDLHVHCCFPLYLLCKSSLFLFFFFTIGVVFLGRCWYTEFDYFFYLGIQLFWVCLTKKKRKWRIRDKLVLLPHLLLIFLAPRSHHHHHHQKGFSVPFFHLHPRYIHFSSYLTF